MHPTSESSGEALAPQQRDEKAQRVSISQDDFAAFFSIGQKNRASVCQGCLSGDVQNELLTLPFIIDVLPLAIFKVLEQLTDGGPMRKIAVMQLLQIGFDPNLVRRIDGQQIEERGRGLQVSDVVRDRKSVV